MQYFETQYREALAHTFTVFSELKAAHACTFWMDNFRKKNAKEALYRTFDLGSV
jgi:hypothetical protein